MPVKELVTPYPVIDIDPHFTRVVRYFRPEDYALWGGAAAAGPLMLRVWDHIDPSKAKHGLRGATRLTAFLGVAGGFMLAYQKSSCTSGAEPKARRAERRERAGDGDGL